MGDGACVEGPLPEYTAGVLQRANSGSVYCSFMHVWQGGHAEVRGHLPGIGSLFALFCALRPLSPSTDWFAQERAPGTREPPGWVSCTEIILRHIIVSGDRTRRF